MMRYQQIRKIQASTQVTKLKKEQELIFLIGKKSIHFFKS